MDLIAFSAIEADATIHKICSSTSPSLDQTSMVADGRGIQMRAECTQLTTLSSTVYLQGRREVETESVQSTSGDDTGIVVVTRWPEISYPREGPRRRQPALSAVGRGDANALQKIISSAPQMLYHINKGGETAAHLAARAGDVDSIALLLNSAPSLFFERDRMGRVPADVISSKRNRLVRVWGSPRPAVAIIFLSTHYSPA
jgi:hypothetical protein